jgi:hypothetical protein
MNKTIFVIYTDVKKEKAAYDKRYAFNTESDVKEGDMLKSDNYKTNVQVVKILPQAFKYFDRNSGELSDVLKSTNQYEIRNIRIIEPLNETDTIIFERLPETEI